MVAKTAQVQDATVYDEEYKSKVNDCEANICKVEIYLKDYETNETIHYLRDTVVEYFLKKSDDMDKVLHCHFKNFQEQRD